MSEITITIPESDLKYTLGIKKALTTLTEDGETKYSKSTYIKLIHILNKELTDVKDILSGFRINYNSSEIIYDCKLNTLTNEFKPKTTNLHCMWCCHQFKTYPVYLPINIENNTKITVYGNGKSAVFCSFNCVQSYNVSLKDHDIMERYRYLLIYYKKVTGITINEITRAPPKELLTIFGGNTTIEEYRNKFKYMYEYDINGYTFASQNYLIRESKRFGCDEASFEINTNPNLNKTVKIAV